MNSASLGTPSSLEVLPEATITVLDSYVLLLVLTKIDLSFLEELPLYIARHAIEGKLIVNRDEDKVFDIVIGLLQKWEDFRPMWELYLDVSINGFGEDSQ